MTGALLDLDRHPLADAAYREQCRATLDVEGALVLPALVPAAVIDSIVAEVAPSVARSSQGRPTTSISPIPSRSCRRCHSTASEHQGLIADDQITTDSPLRAIYGDFELGRFVRRARYRLDPSLRRRTVLNQCSLCAPRTKAQVALRQLLVCCDAAPSASR